ncbi:restriction endonuclease subunit S [Rheinheimera metallidurans]|uniref:restriction endonuclease subunit S n=1 Tax=Rheinheimera metallidurans TaxID=2925781 RepID=UPI003002D1D3
MLVGWNSVRVSDLGKVVTGNTPPRKQPELYGNHTLFIKPTDINIDERYCLTPEECYSEAGFKKYKKSLIPKGSTCVVTIGSIGKKVIIAHDDIFINQAMNAVIPTESYDPFFVFYLLKLNLFQLKIADSGTASGRENVSKSSFSALKVTVPESKIIQSKIAAVLSAYDDLIENNLEQIKLIEEMAQITYEEWFVRLKFPGHEEVDIDSETGFPEGWSKRALKEFCTAITDGTHDSPKPVEKGVPLATGKNILNGFIDFSDTYLISQEDHEKIKKRSGVEEWDILFSNIGTLGNVGVVERDIEFSCKNVVIFKRKTGFECFLYTYLSNCYTKEKLDNQSSGVAQKFYSLKFIRGLEETLPKDELIMAFNDFTKPLYELKYSLKCQSKLLKEARDILLPRLMTGTIDIEQVELPEALLERINNENNNNKINIG